MSTKKKRRWWSSWRRQKELPKRLERKEPSGFGHECVETIYQTLFPGIQENGGLDTDEKMHASNCFENGAFVFEDNEQSLFKILIGDNDTGTRTDNEYGKLEGRKTTRFSSRKTLTHLIPELLKKQGSKRGWVNIEFIFYGPNGETTTLSRANNFGNIKQYERGIYPPIAFICNPQCRVLKSPIYCSQIQQKPYGKGVIKFYSYSIRYVVSGRRASYTTGPYTYVKLESLPASPELDILKQGAARHRGRLWDKASNKRGEDKASVEAMKLGDCLRVRNSKYCYRAEDRGSLFKNISTKQRIKAFKLYNKNHNYFSNMSETSSNAIRNYTRTDIEFLGGTREIYPLRTGQELFVPQEMTTRIIQQLRVGAPDAVRGGGGGGDAAAAAAAEDNEGDKREYKWSESANRYGGKRRKRTHRRRKRRRTRKRRRKIRHYTKKRKRKNK
jgi:hypothetical protein